MDHFPVFLNLRERRVLLLGGNRLATRKAALIAKSGTHICVLATEFSAPMRALAAQNPRVRLEHGSFESARLAGVALVLAATEDDALNRRVYAEADARGIPVNVADQPELCSYILPAIVDRAPVIVAVSTGGRSPVLARYVKSLLERALPQSLGQFALLLKRWRQLVKDTIPEEEQRRRFWESAIDGELSEHANSGDMQAVETALQRRLTTAEHTHSPEHGRLSLIGAPSDDPELLSIKAHRLIRTAEWVFYDEHTPAALLELGRREASTYNVDQFSSQQALELMTRQLSRGQRVVRIYGRDPSLEQEARNERHQLGQAAATAVLLPATPLAPAAPSAVLAHSAQTPLVGAVLHR